MCVKNGVKAAWALSLSLKTVDGIEGYTWSSVFSTSERRSRTLSCFTEGAFWWQKEAGQSNSSYMEAPECFVLKQLCLKLWNTVIVISGILFVDVPKISIHLCAWLHSFVCTWGRFCGCCLFMSTSAGLSLLCLHFTLHTVGAECQLRAERL